MKHLYWILLLPILFIGQIKELSAIELSEGFWASAGNPIATNQTILFGTHDAYLYSLNAKNGKVQWKYKLTDTVVATPLAVGGSIYFGGVKGWLYSLSEQTGKENWKYRVGQGIPSTPLLFNNKLYFTTFEGELFVLNPQNGKLYFKEKITKERLTSPIAGEKVIFLASESGRLWAINPENGKEIWKFETHEPLFDSGKNSHGMGFWTIFLTLNLPSPSYAKNVVYFSTSQNLYAINASDGRLLWKKSGKKNTFPLTHAGKNNLYWGSPAHKIYSLNPKSGQIAWEKPITIIVNPYPLAEYGGVVYLVNQGSPARNNLSAYRAENGERLWEKRFEGMLDSAPAFLNNTLYFSEKGTRLYAINPLNGEKLWEFAVKEIEPPVKKEVVSPTVKNEPYPKKIEILFDPKQHQDIPNFINRFIKENSTHLIDVKQSSGRLIFTVQNRKKEYLAKDKFEQYLMKQGLDLVPIKSDIDWAQYKVGPLLIYFTFKDVDIRYAAGTISKISNKTYIVHPEVKGVISNVSDKPLSPEEVIKIFETLLKEKGYTLTPKENGAIEILPPTLIKKK